MKFSVCIFFFFFFLQNSIELLSCRKIQLSDGQTLLANVNTYLLLHCLFPGPSGWGADKGYHYIMPLRTSEFHKIHCSEIRTLT